MFCYVYGDFFGLYKAGKLADMMAGQTPVGPTNIIFGVVYSIIIVLTMRGAWGFYILLGCVEVALTTAAAWYAWTWFDIVHHRGQITTYLRPMGSTVPQIYRPAMRAKRRSFFI